MKIHETKQLAFTGNHRSTMVRLAPLYVPCFRALFPHLPLAFTALQTTVLVIGAGLSLTILLKNSIVKEHFY
jgi:hypothetical protein